MKQKLTRLQRLAKQEEEGPFFIEELSDADRKYIAGAARQWATKDFKPYGYSPSSAKAEEE